MSLFILVLVILDVVKNDPSSKMKHFFENRIFCRLQYTTALLMISKIFQISSQLLLFFSAIFLMSNRCQKQRIRDYSLLLASIQAPTVRFKLLEMHRVYNRPRDTIRRPYGALSTRTETVSSSYGLLTGAVQLFYLSREISHRRRTVS